MAKTMVAGDLYESITGQLFEIGRQIRQPNGYPFDPVQLKEHLQAAVEGCFTNATGTFKYDRRNDGWTLLENQPRRIDGPIEAVSFLNGGESLVKGDVMAQRAIILDANYSQEDAEWLLEHRDMIPKELRNRYLIFPATKWRVPGGYRFVSYLFFRVDRWYLGFCWLDFDFDGDVRLARPRK